MRIVPVMAISISRAATMHAMAAVSLSRLSLNLELGVVLEAERMYAGQPMSFEFRPHHPSQFGQDPTIHSMKTTKED
jgi:hypothetical protein